MGDIQIVRGCNSLETELVPEVAGGNLIRHVQRKITDAPAVREEIQMIVIADEITIGRARSDLLKNPLFARFENTRRSDEDCRMRIADWLEWWIPDLVGFGAFPNCRQRKAGEEDIDREYDVSI